MARLLIEVNDAAADVGKAKKLGGRVIIPHQKIPDGDEMAVILDRFGIPLALQKPLRDGFGLRGGIISSSSTRWRDYPPLPGDESLGARRSVSAARQRGSPLSSITPG